MTFKPLLSVLAMTLAGCSLTPDYRRPEAPIPQAYPQGGAYAAPAPQRAALIDVRRSSTAPHCSSCWAWRWRTTAICARRC